MASSREKPDNSPVKTKDNPERQSIEAGVGGVLICVGVGSGYLGGLHDHRRVGDGFINDGVSVTWLMSFFFFFFFKNDIAQTYTNTGGEARRTYAQSRGLAVCMGFSSTGTDTLPIPEKFSTTLTTYR